MGEPVYIYDLACDMIRLHGMEPNRDIEIKITGLRPGEKLFEEISLAEENTTKTANDKIYINKPVAYDTAAFSCKIQKLEYALANEGLAQVYACVKALVPTFRMMQAAPCRKAPARKGRTGWLILRQGLLRMLRLANPV